MQNAVDIMAMVQRTNVARQKSDVPGKTFGSEGSSFRKEFNQAKDAVSKNSRIESKEADLTAQRTTENKAEKLAKVMSGSGAKAEVKDKQTIDAEIESKQAEKHEEKDRSVTEETAQAILEMLKNLMQTPNTQPKELETKLQGVIQKLEEVLSMPGSNQTADLAKLVGSINSDLTEIFKQLEAATIPQLEVKQPEKANMEHEAIQQLPKQEVKIGEREVIKAESKASEAVMPETGQQVRTDGEVKTSNNKEKEDQDTQEQKEPYTEVKAAIGNKVAVAGDKPNQNDIQLMPQNEKINLQLNVKQVNPIQSKESFVKINSTDIINQVIKKADIIVQGSHQEMIMKLEPESLGKLNLKLVVENGLITAKFVAESQQVKEVLESSFNQLKDALQEKGIAVQSLSVSVGQQGGEFRSSQGFEQWKKTIKLGSKSTGDYLEADDEISFNTNPYSYHEGKVDYRA